MADKHSLVSVIHYETGVYRILKLIFACIAFHIFYSRYKAEFGEKGV